MNAASPTQTFIAPEAGELRRAKSLNLQTADDPSAPTQFSSEVSSVATDPTLRNESAASVHATNIAVTRSLARQMDEGQKKALFKDHSALAAKVALGDATPAERARLQTVRWAIDRLQDAEFGEGLDDLEVLARSKKELVRQMDALIEKLGSRNRRAKKATRR